jgi:hypothetical protein
MGGLSVRVVCITNARTTVVGMHFVMGSWCGTD